MIRYEEMQYLAAFAEMGTLSAVAEKYHISQPTVTRSMMKIEEEFALPLFERTKNKIKLNDNGILAAKEALRVIEQTDNMLLRVRAYDKENHRISLGSAAAIQIPELMRRLSETFPHMIISNEPKKPEALISGLESGAYQLIVLPFSPDNPAFLSTKVGEEHLMFYLPKAHRFSKRKSLTLAEMNGENMLLFSDIGFWHDLVAAKMPDSRFLVQNERYSLDELILNTILPCFSTDLSMGSHAQTGKRVCVPISDTEVNVTYYLLCKKENRKIFSALFPKPG